MDEVDDELMPDEARAPRDIGWPLQLGSTVVLTLQAAPLWYLVYVRGMASDDVAGLYTEYLSMLPEAVAFPAFFALGVVALFGPWLGANLHVDDIRARGGEASRWWVLVALAGVQLWPMQWVVVLALWRRRRGLKT